MHIIRILSGDSMHCPFCSNEDTKVVDSRVGETDVRRRRECGECSRRFTTHETAELELVVVKRDNSRERFDRGKIRNGIIRACSKRPIVEEQIEAMTVRVEQNILSYNAKEIETSLIGSLVMKELLNVDKIAYIRFASVCKQFDDPKLFEKELALIKD